MMIYLHHFPQVSHEFFLFEDRSLHPQVLSHFQKILKYFLLREYIFSFSNGSKNTPASKLECFKNNCYGLTVPITLSMNSSSTIGGSKSPAIISSVLCEIKSAMSDGTSELKSYNETSPVSIPPQ